ncbi:6-phosphogluconolactonase [Candidatus Hartigia pinicola]|nr:6-phosphogluconolactonase [Candidatus Hartigia pinicola]
MYQVIYIASSWNYKIHVWSMNQSGELTLLQTVTTPDQVQTMVLSHDKKYLYVGVRLNVRIITYQVEKTGILYLKSEIPIPSIPVHLSLDRNGKYLFIPSYHQNNLTVLPINSNGIPQSAIHVVEGLGNPHSSYIDIDNKQLWVPCLGEDNIRLFKLNKDGRLTESSEDKISTEKGSGPRHIAFHPKEKIIYCLNELHSTINVYYKYTCYRQIQHINIYPEEKKIFCWAADIHITPDGRHLYASERSDSYISHFLISNNGKTLTLENIYPTVKQPRSFNIDTTGRFLISSGQKTNNIAVSAIDSITGKLTQINCYPVGNNPIWVTVLAF